MALPASVNMERLLQAARHISKRKTQDTQPSKNTNRNENNMSNASAPTTIAAFVEAARPVLIAKGTRLGASERQVTEILDTAGLVAPTTTGTDVEALKTQARTVIINEGQRLGARTTDLNRIISAAGLDAVTPQAEDLETFKQQCRDDLMAAAARLGARDADVSRILTEAGFTPTEQDFTFSIDVTVKGKTEAEAQAKLTGVWTSIQGIVTTVIGNVTPRLTRKR